MRKFLLGLIFALFAVQASATEYWIVGDSDKLDTNVAHDLWVIIGKPGGTLTIAASGDTCRYNTPSDELSGDKANYYGFTFYEVTALTVDTTSAKGARLPLKMYHKDTRPDPGKKGGTISFEAASCTIGGATYWRATTADIL